jgi:hypothetical protein
VLVQEEPSSKGQAAREIERRLQGRDFTLCKKRFPQESGLFEVKIGSDATFEEQRMKMENTEGKTEI